MNSIAKPAAEKAATGKTPAAAPTPVSKPKPSGLFRKIDWLALLIAFAGIWITYLITLAPELTLEDSGELCTGSFYAGIPHPPGYPFWAIYSWLWTVILPIGNVAWRVEVGESFAAAMACGMVALMVSRGSSMLIEGIEGLSTLSRRAENSICLVSGAVAGLLLGFGQVMWSESVAINRISLFGVPWTTAVALLIMRWIHTPHKRWYLYLAMYIFGICTTIHQTLLIMAMGIEVGIIMANPRLGRTFLMGNSVLFIVGLIAYYAKLSPSVNDLDHMFKVIFCVVGVTSICGYIWLAITTRETLKEFWLDGSFAGCLLLGAAYGVGGSAFFAFLSVLALGAFIWLTIDTWKLGHEPIVVIICGVLIFLGASFYFYEAISGMTDPPMQWGYPRTVQGFFHALERGQYEKSRPTDLFSADGMSRFYLQLGFLVRGVAEEFNWVLLFVALVPLIFLFKMRKRERALIVFLTAVYCCIGLLLVVIMNPSSDRSSEDLHKVFFTSSHGIVAILIGFGMALIAAFMATHYQQSRQWGLLGGGLAVVIAIYALSYVTDHYYGGPGGLHAGPIEMLSWVAFAFGAHHVGLPIFASLILIALPLVFIGALLLYKQRAPLAVMLGVFAILPVYSAMCHWASSEQRNHWFGYWFGHDMFTPPYDIYPTMTRDAILFGGTDPGRFCPTYMIFCESFIPHKDQPAEDQHFDRRDVYIITQNALADNTYLEYLRAQYNRSKQIDPPFFQELLRSDKEKEENYKTNFIARLAYNLLDKPLTKFGAKVEARRRAEGVYPPKEIYIPTDDDSGKCFQEYYNDAGQRAYHDQNFPNEPRQIRQGEEVHYVDGRLSISGQTAVMSINGLLTKVIFDRNPTNEFFVEESFPLDWMYPYETPYGIIMKINRQPLDSMGEDVVKKDHEFWSKYSERMMGNWITYDTPVKQVAEFAKRVYQHHDLTGFDGNRRFVRDEQAQKAFSKLRSSIGGLYDFRAFHPTGKDPLEQQRMLKEADFAYKQAFALCPYSPEAVYRYVMLLVRLQRIDDAKIVADTCYDFDPKNPGVENLKRQIDDMKKGVPSGVPPSPAQMQIVLEQKLKEMREHPDNLQSAFDVASIYLQIQQTNKAIEILDAVLSSPKVNEGAVLAVARVFSQLNNLPKLETALEKLTRMNPTSPEAWYDYAAIKVFLGKQSEALPALKHAMEENAKRLAKDPKASNLADRAKNDPTFKSLQSSPEFQQLVK